MDWLGQAVGNLAGEAVSLFIPIGTEIPTAPLARRLRRRRPAGAARRPRPDRPLLFREWQEGVTLAPSPGPGRASIPAPPECAEVIEPDVLVVPLAAFDASGAAARLWRRLFMIARSPAMAPAPAYRGAGLCLRRPAIARIAGGAVDEPARRHRHRRRYHPHHGPPRPP